MVEKFSIWVEMVDNRVCIIFVGGCENDELKFLGQSTEHLLAIWPNNDPDLLKKIWLMGENFER